MKGDPQRTIGGNSLRGCFHMQPVGVFAPTKKKSLINGGGKVGPLHFCRMNIFQIYCHHCGMHLTLQYHKISYLAFVLLEYVVFTHKKFSSGFRMEGVSLDASPKCHRSSNRNAWIGSSKLKPKRGKRVESCKRPINRNSTEGLE